MQRRTSAALQRALGPSTNVEVEHPLRANRRHPLDLYGWRTTPAFPILPTATRILGTPGSGAELNPTGIQPQHRGLQKMSSSKRKKPTLNRSGSSRTKRKLARSASMTKALVNKADHVKKQALKPATDVRAPGKGSGTHKKPSTDGTRNTPELLPTAANENLRPVPMGPTQALAF